MKLISCAVAGLLLLSQLAPHARCQVPQPSLLSPNEVGTVRLEVSLSWSVTAQSMTYKRSFIPVTTVLADKIVFTRSGISPEASNFGTNCGKSVQQKFAGVPSVEAMQAILDCEHGVALQDAAVTKYHGVILTVDDHSQKCTQTRLPGEYYKICGRIIAAGGDRLRLQYEEDTETDGRLAEADRATFEIVLQRRASGLLAGQISGCEARLMSAFSVVPQNPSKLIAATDIRPALCRRMAY